MKSTWYRGETIAKALGLMRSVDDRHHRLASQRTAFDPFESSLSSRIGRKKSRSVTFQLKKNLNFPISTSVLLSLIHDLSKTGDPSFALPALALVPDRSVGISQRGDATSVRGQARGSGSLKRRTVYRGPVNEGLKLPLVGGRETETPADRPTWRRRRMKGDYETGLRA